MYQAPLACLHWVPPADPGSPPGVLVEDCRKIFSPLTAIAPPATAEAIHVTGVSWANDDVIRSTRSSPNGLTINLDQTPSQSDHRGELHRDLRGSGSPSQQRQCHLSDRRGNSDGFDDRAHRPVVDAKIITGDNAISWQLPLRRGKRLRSRSPSAFLNTPDQPRRSAQLFARVRVRLLGQMIFAAQPARYTWTDKRTASRRPAGAHAADRPAAPVRQRARLPSDFESWFYLAPTLLATSLGFNFGPPPGTTVPALTVVVSPLNTVTGVNATVNNQVQSVSPMVTRSS